MTTRDAVPEYLLTHFSFSEAARYLRAFDERVSTSVQTYFVNSLHLPKETDFWSTSNKENDEQEEDIMTVATET